MMFFMIALVYFLLAASSGHSVAKRQSTDVNITDLFTQVKLLENKVNDLKRSITTQCNNNTDTSQPFPKDCCDALKRGFTQSGPYAIQPDTAKPPFIVWCDMDTDGGGWTVIMRRNDSYNFARNWEYFADGFGPIDNSFWLGLENMHSITKWECAPPELRVDLLDWEGGTAHARYNSFWIGDASSQYAIFVDGYSGDAGDSLTYHNGMRFSTSDRDNDIWSESCATTHFGSWWYRKCHASNLNGPYSTSATVPNGIGVTWFNWKNSHKYSMKRAEMKVRPRKCQEKCAAPCM